MEFKLSDFCVDAEELQITQRTDSSRMNYSDGYIKTSGFVFSWQRTCDCLLLLSLRWKMFYKFSLKTPQLVIITQHSASEPKAAGPVRSMKAILERHLADKMLDLRNFLSSI